MEKAEDFAERLASAGMWAMHTSVELKEGGVAAKMIEADRAAVALAVLDQINAMIGVHITLGCDSLTAYVRALLDIRAQYAETAGGE